MKQLMLSGALQLLIKLLALWLQARSQGWMKAIKLRCP